MLICGLISHHRASVHCTGDRLRTAGLAAPLQHVRIAIPYSTEGIYDEEVIENKGHATEPAAAIAGIQWLRK